MEKRNRGVGFEQMSWFIRYLQEYLMSLQRISMGCAQGRMFRLYKRRIFS